MTKLRWLLLLAVPLAIGAGLFAWSKQPLEVRVAAVERDVPIRVFGLGTLEARILSRIGFEVPGVLVTLEADHGDRVAQGAVLARLEPASHAARVARAEAVLQRAEAQQGRVAATAKRAAAVQAQKDSLAPRRRELANRGSVSVEAAEPAETDVNTAAARATQSLLAIPPSRATSTTWLRPAGSTRCATRSGPPHRWPRSRRPIHWQSSTSPPFAPRLTTRSPTSWPM